MEATINISEQVLACLRCLSGQCDGAQEQDGHGFNKLDSQFGKSLADRSRLTNNQIIAAIRMLKKYSKQLENAGLHLPTVTSLVVEQKEQVEEAEIMPMPEEDNTPEPIQQIQEKNVDITLSAEQKALLEVMEGTRQHLFITGRAGAGKSVLLRHFREQTKKRIVVAAPTGIAALNVQGQTLHSLFKLPPQLHRSGTLAPNDRVSSLLKRIDTLVIDEISMVRADLLDAVDERLRQACRNDLPFGGKQIIMFGDPYQLPPVVEDGLRDYFEAVHGGHFFFNALAWKQAEFKIFELTQVFRQKDPIFKDVLNAVRDGSATDEQIAQLNVRHGAAIPAEGTVTLAPTNNLVTQINQERLNRLPGKAYEYQAAITGQMKRSVFPTEERLQFKVGAQIVLLKNDKDGRWVNGTVGKIEKLADAAIEVNVGGIVHALERETWEEIAYTYDHDTQKVELQVVSSFTQYPIRLAWALTIHKSQGQTYESVALDLTTSTFAAGQMYVALSRCTSLEGLYLKMPVKRRDIIVEPKVLAFMSRRETITVVEAQAEEIHAEAIAIIEEAQAVTEDLGDCAESVSIIRQAQDIAELLIEATPEQATVKPVAISLPTITNKGGNQIGNVRKTSGLVKVAYKFSPEVVAKLDKLKESQPDLNKSAFIDSLLAQWFEKHGL